MNTIHNHFSKFQFCSLPTSYVEIFHRNELLCNTSTMSYHLDSLTAQINLGEGNTFPMHLLFVEYREHDGKVYGLVLSLWRDAYFSREMKP